MLFSDDHVAALINNRFEAAWESVRPVPLVTINFGNGHVLTRTLNGNIATYVCTADGKMLDVLPGVYEPTTYLDRLDQFGKPLVPAYLSGRRRCRGGEHDPGEQ